MMAVYVFMKLLKGYCRGCIGLCFFLEEGFMVHKGSARWPCSCFSTITPIKLSL